MIFFSDVAMSDDENDSLIDFVPKKADTIDIVNQSEAAACQTDVVMVDAQIQTTSVATLVTVATNTVRDAAQNGKSNNQTVI